AARALVMAAETRDAGFESLDMAAAGYRVKAGSNTRCAALSCVDMLTGNGLVGRVAIAACALGAAVPFACGGDAFTAGSADGGKTIDGSIDGAFGGDSMTADAPAEGSSDAPADSPIELDGFGVDGAVNTVMGPV